MTNQTKAKNTNIFGAAYIRFNSPMLYSYFLNSQLLEIKKRAARDGVELVNVFSDRGTPIDGLPGVMAMWEAAHRGEFEVLYVPQLDRLTRSEKSAQEIINELQSMGIALIVLAR